MIITLVSIYFDSPRLGHTIKTNCMKFQTVDVNFEFLEKVLVLVSPPHFMYSHVIFIARPNFIAFTSSDIGQ